MAPKGPPWLTRNEDGTFVSREVPETAFPDHLNIWEWLCNFSSPHRSAPHRDWPWFIESNGHQVTFGEIYNRVDGLSRALNAELSLEEDDVIAIFSPNATNWPVVTWSAFAAGAIVTPANPTYSDNELAFQLRLVRRHYPLKAIFVHPSTLKVGLRAAEKLGLPANRVFLLSEEADEHREYGSLQGLLKKHANAPAIRRKRWGQGDAKKRLALLTASSGTTGLPKIIAIPHYAVSTNVMINEQHFRGLYRHGEDRVLALLPFYHIYGLIMVLHSSCYMHMPMQTFAKFEFEPVLQGIATNRLNVLFLVPPLVNLMVKNPITDKYSLSHVRAVMVGAAPLGDAIFTAFRQKFPHASFGQAYGMSETSTLVFTWPWNSKKQWPGASCGILLNGLTVKIIDPESGKLLSFGERGELCIKSPSNAMCYLGNEKATAETFRDGFVHSGDEACVDEEGNFYITDRLKELIKVKGNQCAPAELEDHLLSFPDVADVAVIGVPDDYAGELPRAYVVLNSAAAKRCTQAEEEIDRTKEAIKQHVAQAKAHYKHLKGGVEFIEAIPKNPSGKLLRRMLRDKVRQEMAASSQAKL